MNGQPGLLARLRTRARIPPPATSPHASRAAGILRPLVFGGSDGLVSNLSLVMGMAGAVSEGHVVVIAGVAGLLAGAFSMAVGEYVSVRSQHELFEGQQDLQRRQLREQPEEERRILEEIYVSRGFDARMASEVAATLLATPERALETMVRDEIGLDPRAIGGPFAAAGSSFASFVSGAAVPVLPFLFLSGATAIWISVAISLATLFALGVGVARLTGRSRWVGGLRQLALGGVAAAVTYGVGYVIGAQV
jgi:VIT1/CCC1 family predicted Fe2+/Mn2+ transporter